MYEWRPLSGFLFSEKVIICSKISKKGKRMRFEAVLIEIRRFCFSHTMVYLLFAAILMAPREGYGANLPQNAGYIFEKAVAEKPTIHDVGERIRIAGGIDPDRIAEGNEMRTQVMTYTGIDAEKVRTHLAPKGSTPRAFADDRTYLGVQL